MISMGSAFEGGCKPMTPGTGTATPLNIWLADGPDWMRSHLVVNYDRLAGRNMRYLDEYAQYLESLHLAFNRYLDTLDPTLRNAIAPMVRTRRGDALHFEWCAFMVGYTLGLEDREALTAAGVGCIAGSTYTILQDNRIDDPSESDWQTEACGNVLLSKCIQAFQSLVPDRHDFLEVVNDVFHELALAYFAEQRDHRWRVKPYDEASDVQMIVGRSAPVKLCLWSLAVRAGREDAIPDLYEAVGHLIQAIQIRDDLSDYREDYRSGYMSHVVTETLLRLGVGSITPWEDAPEWPSEEELFVTLYTSGLIEDLLVECNDHLNSVLTIVSKYNAMPLSLFISAFMLLNEVRAERLLKAKSAILSEASSPGRRAERLDSSK